MHTGARQVRPYQERHGTTTQKEPNGNATLANGMTKKEDAHMLHIREVGDGHQSSRGVETKPS
jgi:hypothetical protein